MSAATVKPPAESQLAEVYREHHAFVWQSLRRLGVGPEGVSDATQDVFMVVHRRLGEFEHRASIRTWLFRIAMRVASDHRRRSRRGTTIDASPSLQDPAVDLDRTMAGREAFAILERLLGCLDEDQRATFVLSELEGMTAPEIAMWTQAKVDTVYSRLRLARQKLERALRREAARAERKKP